MDLQLILHVILLILWSGVAYKFGLQSAIRRPSQSYPRQNLYVLKLNVEIPISL